MSCIFLVNTLLTSWIPLSSEMYCVHLMLPNIFRQRKCGDCTFYRTWVQSLAMLVTHSLTDWLTNWLPFSKLDWCDPGMWRWQLKTCWSCYCWGFLVRLVMCVMVGHRKLKILTKPCAESLNKSFALWPNLGFQICNKLLPTLHNSHHQHQQQ